jgi:hypothetical protein
MIKFLKMLIGLALLPVCWAMSAATYKLYQLSGDTSGGGMMTWALPIGFALWVALYFVLPRPTRTYVFGHELTHALWALMMGGRVGELRVGRDGGHVAVTKTNFVITLAPYFFPFYCFLVIAIYYLAGIWFDVVSYKAWWLGAVGFTWAFHVTFTVHMLTERQPDIQEHGRIFSYAIIYLMNVLVIGVWMVLIGSPRINSYSDLLAHEAAAAYTHTWRMLVTSWVYSVKWIKSF